LKRNVGILVFDNAEVLDFAGPFEVFSVTLLPDNVKPFDVFCVAKNDNIISAVNGLQVKANYTVHNHPPIDILIISGGWGIRGVLDDPEIMEWIKNTIENCGLTLSICSGALALAKLGLLAGKHFARIWMFMVACIKLTLQLYLKKISALLDRMKKFTLQAAYLQE